MSSNSRTSSANISAFFSASGLSSFSMTSRSFLSLKWPTALLPTIHIFPHHHQITSVTLGHNLSTYLPPCWINFTDGIEFVGRLHQRTVHPAGSFYYSCNSLQAIRKLAQWNTYLQKTDVNKNKIGNWYLSIFQCKLNNKIVQTYVL